MDKPLRFSCQRGLTSFVKEGDMLDGLSDWRIYETPGHASSHLVLFDEKSGTMIGGDLILAHISPNPLIEPPYLGEKERRKSMIDYVASIKKMLKLPINRVLPGHGETVQNVQQLLEERLHQQEKRATKVEAFVKENPATVYEICQHLFPKVFEKQLLLTLSETLGQVDYLMEKKRIEVDATSLPYRYKAKERVS
jgi:glyoxylase-like metal-dependent hydrolase (beta-lactamase superfamily II)